jgi:hypothetical protein
MARKRSFRFGLPIVFAGRPSVGGVGLGRQSIRWAARFGAPGSVWPDSVSDSKSPRRIYRRGLNSCDHEDMPVICPTCQNVLRDRSKGRAVFLCMGLFSIFSLRARRAQVGSVAPRLSPPINRDKTAVAAFAAPAHSLCLRCLSISPQGPLKNVSEAKTRAGSQHLRL